MDKQALKAKYQQLIDSGAIKKDVDLFDNMDTDAELMAAADVASDMDNYHQLAKSAEAKKIENQNGFDCEYYLMEDGSVYYTDDARSLVFPGEIDLCDYFNFPAPGGDE